jgi:hypothetical protein
VKGFDDDDDDDVYSLFFRQSNILNGKQTALYIFFPLNATK